MLQHYNAVGITSIIDRGAGAGGLSRLPGAARSRRTDRAQLCHLPDRRRRARRPQVRQEIEHIPFITGMGDEWFRVGTLKTVIDGGILIGTAYLREPWGEHTEIYGFVDPGYRGVLTVPRENVFEMAKTADELGWQMTSHTTGGGAIDLLLDAYEAADQEQVRSTAGDSR